jgi:hypothetical protein
MRALPPEVHKSTTVGPGNRVVHPGLSLAGTAELFHRQSLYPEAVQPTLLFPAQSDLTPEIPPTWSEDSAIYHITAKCTRLQAIHRNNRLTGKPGAAMRPCFNCEDIIRTKRSG